MSMISGGMIVWRFIGCIGLVGPIHVWHHAALFLDLTAPRLFAHTHARFPWIMMTITVASIANEGSDPGDSIDDLLAAAD